MTEGMKGKDPDKGPPVVEGAYMFDKGYKSDNDHFAPPGAFPQDEERGNRYMKNQNDIVARDSSKMRKQKFSKIH
jgi:hypothetical protein